MNKKIFKLIEYQNLQDLFIEFIIYLYYYIFIMFLLLLYLLSKSNFIIVYQNKF